MALTQGLPTLCGLVLVAYAFKFALLAGINQGCITSLFSIVGVYVSIIFYFKFNEVISISKIVGIIMMIPCILLLTLDPKDEADLALIAETQMQDLTEQQMKFYGFIAILFGLAAPSFWTIKIFFVRLIAEENSFTINDLVIDNQFFLNLPAIIILIGYFATGHPFVLHEFIEG